MSGIVITPLDRLKKLHARLLANPEQHNQDIWYEKSEECGTTACAAGWAVLDAAADDPRIGFNLLALPGAAEIMTAVRLEPDGPARGVSAAARALLGLTAGEANYLFYECNNEEAVGYIAHLIKDREAAA